MASENHPAMQRRRPMGCALAALWSAYLAVLPGLQQLVVGNGFALGLFVGQLGPRRALVGEPLVRVALLVELGCALGHARAFQTRHHLVHLLGQVVHGGLRRFLASHCLGHVLPPELSELGIVGHVGAGGRPGDARRALVELDQTAVLVGVLGEVFAADVRIADEGQALNGLLERRRLGRHELRVKPRGGCLVGVVAVEESPTAYVLVAVLHAVFPIRTMRARSHAPLRRTVGIHHRQAGLGHVRREGGVPEDLLRNMALRRHRARFAKGHARGFLGRVFLHPVHILGERIDGCGRVGRTTARDRCTHGRALVVRHANAPFVHRHAVGNALVGRARHRQPRVGEAPTQRWVLLAVIHVAVDRLAIDLLHIVGEELGDVFISAPVLRHAQVVAILGLELVLQILARKQIGAEPVQVGELLVG
ncbi:hypothetical protein SDC9_131302 [bioreactor metagenome]|uniref:Uncharacterized protein n=1 Tax=bioreactor metagenome TaxID=1076179 RepID=A0A645D4U0_9ZZZZ